MLDEDLRENSIMVSNTGPQNKAELLAACGHVSASSQSLRFILSLNMNSRYIYQGLILTNTFYIVLLSLVTQYFSQKKHTLLYQLNIHRFAIMYSFLT